MAFRLISSTVSCVFSSSRCTISSIETGAPFIKIVSLLKSSVSKYATKSAVVWKVMQLTNSSLNCEIVSPIPITRLILFDTTSCATLE
jgi:hypothetical protein